MAAPMKASLKFFNSFLGRRRTFFYSGCRYLLTEEYKCSNAWNQRLQSPLLQKIEISSFIEKLQEKVEKNGQITAIDMDIVASKLVQLPKAQFDYIQSLFYRFRHSQFATQARESMSHAILRTFLDLGETGRLMTMLRDKIHYGIFLDHFTASLLMDHFIEKKHYSEAAEVAIDLMLQEELDHPLCRALAWHACHLRLSELLGAGEDQVEQATEADDGEVMYKRVAFIEVPWYDDHFDIPTERMRIGKTLATVTGNAADAFGRGYHLIGWALYEKFDRVTELLQAWLNDSPSTPAVCSQELDVVRRVIDTVKTKEPPKEQKEPGLLTIEDMYPFITEKQKTGILEQFAELVEKLKAAGRVAPSSSEDSDRHVARLTTEVYDKVRQTDVTRQTATYARWTAEQQSELDKQLEQYRVEKKKRELAKRLVSLQNREEKLRFFEQQSRIDLTIHENPPVELKVDEIKKPEEQWVLPPSERKAGGGDAMKKKSR